MKKLNLGCGSKWKEQYPDYKGLDIIDFGQDYVTDVMDFVNWAYKEEYDEIMANHFLEHFSQDELKEIFNNINFALKPNGLFKFVVPHKDKGKSWVLPHKTFWCEETVGWLEEEEANSVYGFGKWKIEKMVVNKRKDIHVWLRNIK